MKNGDKFYHSGSWNTEPGWWEVTRAEESCGMVRAKPIGEFTPERSVEKESEWHSSYVEKAVAEAQSA